MPYLSEAYDFVKVKDHGKESFTYKVNMWVVWLMLATSKPLFRHLHKRGVHIMFWVINEEEDLDRVRQKYCNNKDYLIDGIITDRP